MEKISNIFPIEGTIFSAIGKFAENSIRMHVITSIAFGIDKLKFIEFSLNIKYPIITEIREITEIYAETKCLIIDLVIRFLLSIIQL